MDARTLAEQEQTGQIERCEFCGGVRPKDEPPFTYSTIKHTDTCPFIWTYKLWDAADTKPWREAAKLTKDYKELIEKSQWIKITDDPLSLPRTGELVWVVIDGVVQVTPARLDEVWEWLNEAGDSAPKEAVSHWQKYALPAPPEEHP